jgi:hypothetical protein
VRILPFDFVTTPFSVMVVAVVLSREGMMREAPRGGKQAAKRTKFA